MYMCIEIKLNNQEMTILLHLIQCIDRGEFDERFNIITINKINLQLEGQSNSHGSIPLTVVILMKNYNFKHHPWIIRDVSSNND